MMQSIKIGVLVFCLLFSAEYVQAQATAVSIHPVAAYVGSTITVTGANFPVGTCTAKVGATPSSGTAATSCTYVSDTIVVVVIGAGTPAGVASSVELTFSDATIATVAGTTLTVTADPAAAAISPAAAFRGSTITVTGTNFISGFACTAKVGAVPSVGTAAMSCTYASATTVTVVIGAATPAAASSVELYFTNGFKTATVALTPLMVTMDPTATSISPTTASAGSTITVTGTNFISGFVCTAKVGAPPSSGTAAICSVASATEVVVMIGTGTPTVASSVELTFTNGAKTATVAGTTLTIVAETATTAAFTFTSIFNLGGQDSGSTALPVLQFTPGTDVMPGQTIALHMPPGYFLGTVTSISSTIALLMATSAAVTATSTTLVLTTAGAATGTASITMTLTGLTLGAAQAASVGGFKLSLNGGALSNGLDAPGIAMGTTAMVPHAVMFTIMPADRIPGKAGVPVTLSFTTSAALPIGGKITLNYPAGFFAPTPNPGNNAAGTTSVAPMTATSVNTGNSIVITTAIMSIPASTHFTITLSGLMMGAATAGSATGITVQTDSDTVASAGAASGGIGVPTFVIAAADRIAGKAGVPVTLSFTPQTALPIGGKITLNYPPGFFAAAPNPAANPMGTTSLPIMATSAITGNSIVITTDIMGIPAYTHFTITLSGLTMGAATPGSSTGITVQTSVDTAASYGVSSGPIDSGMPSAPSPLGCVGQVLSPNGCSGQAAYFITELTPIFCPQGMTFAPMGVTVVGAAMCPVPYPSPAPAEFCRPLPVPAACSAASVKIANIPDLCGTGKYPSFSGFDHLGCPFAPTATTSESGSGLVANPCTQSPLDAARCGPQAAYLILVLSPVFCPYGFFFAPFGVTAVNSTMCPVTRSNPPGAMCRAKPVPAVCSEASKLVANIPDLCGFDSYSGPGGFDPIGCPVTPTSGGGAPSPAPPPSYQQPQQQSNALQLAFQVSHMCPSQKVTRDCLVKNPSFPSAMSSQCSNHLINGATAATRAVCVYLSKLNVNGSTYATTMIDLATLLSSEVNPFVVCLERTPSMKQLLRVISNTESRDPRDPSATATNLLNLCFSSCASSSTTALLTLFAEGVQFGQPKAALIPGFCTSPLMAIMWQHAANSPRECSDSLISIVSVKMNLTACALRSVLSTYVAACDTNAIQCEQDVRNVTIAEADACTPTIEHNAPCSSECSNLVHKFASGSQCMLSVYSNQELLAHVVNETCSDSAAFVATYSSRVRYETMATALNTRCSPATPFLHMPATKAIFAGAQSALVNSNYPAACFSSWGESRKELSLLTVRPIFVNPVSFSLTMNMSNLQTFAGMPDFGSSFGTLATSVVKAYGNQVAGTRTPMFTFALFDDVRVDYASDMSHVSFVWSAYFVALNTEEPSPVDLNWKNNVISDYHSKTSSADFRNLVTSQSLQIFADFTTSKIIPSMQSNAPSVFEFSAAPLLLQRLYNLPNQRVQSLGFGTPAWNGFGCKIGSFGPLSAGTLYAGDGVVVQHAHSNMANGCKANLRYPRSSFAPGNITFLWSRASSGAGATTANPMDLFQPDAKAIYGHAGDATVEYGRIIVNMASDDSIAYQYTVSGNPIQVTDNQVVLDFFVAENQTLTVYAVNRHKIESFETDVTAGLVPMQPSAHRSIPVLNGFFVDKPKPVDFTCTELDLSGMPFGTRAVLTLVANGSFDPDASVMTYYYAHSDELVRPAPYSPQHCTVEGPHFDVQSGQAVPHCSDYYRLALHRQHTNSTLFRDFSPAIGKAYLINNPGYYVACVAASDKDASSVHQDGVVIARFQKKDVKDKSSCPAAGTPSTPYPSIPSTNPLYPSFTTFAAPHATTTEHVPPAPTSTAPPAPTSTAPHATTTEHVPSTSAA